MNSNSRPVTSTIASGSQSSSHTGVADSYSDHLMDDLFGDVDRILDGDLSQYMTFVGHKPRPATPTSRTVQLPSNFTPTSAADLYQAAVNATPAQPTTHYSKQSRAGSTQYTSRATVNQTTVATSHASARSRKTAGYYHNGGRPVTPLGAYVAQSGNFQSAVIQDGQRSATTTVEVHPTSVQSSGDFYGKSTAATPISASARPVQTVFEPKKESQTVSVPFLLMGAAGISLASTLGLLALDQGAPQSGWQFALSTEATAAELPGNTDAEFLSYLQRSLDTIYANQQARAQTMAVIPVSAPATLPTTVPNVNQAAAPGALPNLPGAQAQQSGVIERVFVPVYQNQQSANVAVSTGQANVPNVAVPNTRQANRPTVPVPAPVAAAAAIPPGAPANQTASIPVVNASESSLPTPSAPANVAVAPTNSAVSQLTDVTPDSELALVGVLNLGSRSAALFDIDGSSQRAYVGDRIGLSNWTLVSVNGQDVVIRRDGEVRSVYIGQRF